MDSFIVKDGKQLIQLVDIVLFLSIFLRNIKFVIFRGIAHIDEDIGS